MPSPEQDFTVRAATRSDDDSVLGVLAGGYGRPHTPEWLKWKHEDNPWGPSRCWIAEDEVGALGVVFGLPWRLHLSGMNVPAFRLVDGATTPRAQRRGVFRRVVAAELEAATQERAVVIATATPEARDAHVKNGAVALDPIRARYRVAIWRPAAVDSGFAILGSWLPPSRIESLHTEWSESALRWRLDPRSGIQYSVSRLRNAKSDNGVVHRTVSRHGFRTLVITAQWGKPSEVARLIAALAWQSKAAAVLAPEGVGAVAERSRFGKDAGSSLLCVWSAAEAVWTPSACETAGWALDGLALEGVM